MIRRSSSSAQIEQIAKQRMKTNVVRHHTILSLNSYGEAPTTSHPALNYPISQQLVLLHLPFFLHQLFIFQLLGCSLELLLKPSRGWDLFDQQPDCNRLARPLLHSPPRLFLELALERHRPVLYVYLIIDRQVCVHYKLIGRYTFTNFRKLCTVL